MRMALTCAAALLAAGSAHAFEDPEREWAHKDWRAAFKEGQCRISTGGDGAGNFEITFDMGGFNGDAAYLPIVYSNYPPPLREDDEYEVLIDGRASAFGSEMWFFDGPDAHDRYMVGASLTGGFVPDLVAALRRGDRLAIQVTHSGEAAHVADDFSLSGFTANFLKIAEWCHFDPDNLFRS